MKKSRSKQEGALVLKKYLNNNLIIDDSPYIDSGKTQEERDEIDKISQEKNKELKDWSETN